MKLIEHLPPRIREIKELYDIQEAIEPELLRIDRTVEQYLRNRNPLKADREGIELWEEWLRITPDPGDSLTRRGERILAQLNERLPYTMPQLYRMLTGILGEENFSMYSPKGKAVLNVDINSKSDVYDSVFRLLQHVVPAHVLWILRSYIDTEEAKSSVGAFVYFGQELTLNPYEEHEVTTDTHKIYTSAHVSMEINKWQ